MSKYRCKILEIMDEGDAMSPWELAEALISWMSEADAKEFYEMYFEEAEEEGEE